MEKKNRYKAILYSRVSTVHDEQAESIDNQILLAENYLTLHPEIELAEPLEKYSERISGKTDNRPKFQELCDRLSKGDIRYLMVKDLKRLSRSVETTYAFFNLMKSYGFEIIQLSTGSIIDSAAFEEVESNLLLGIEALFAQNTVLTQSRYGKTVQKVRCDNKRLSYKDSTLFGYKWSSEKEDIVIVEEEAEIVKELFNRYVFRNQGIQELRGYLSSCGLYYSNVTVSKWLQESKYIGDWTINRKGSTLGIGQGAKSHRFTRNRDEWIHIPRPDLAIVDEELFGLAQEIRSSRVRTYACKKGEKKIGNFQGKHLFAGKIYCAECGSSYRFKYADRKQTIGTYQDSFNTKTHDLSEQCPNVLFRKVYEEDLVDIVVNSISALNIKGRISISMLVDAISYAITCNTGNTEKINAETRFLKRLEREADKVTCAFVDASSSMRDRLNAQLEEIEKKICDCKARIKKLEDCSEDEVMLKEKLMSIRKALTGWINITREALNRTIIENLIFKIAIHKDGQVDVVLKSSGIMQFQLGNASQNSRNYSDIGFTLPSEEKIEANLRTLCKETEDANTKGTIDIASFQETNRLDDKANTINVSLLTE